MIKIKNIDQIPIPGLETWRNQYSASKLKILESSWAGIFREFVLPELPIEKILKHYKAGGRPTKELFSTMGATILQQFFNLTDEETIAELAFNQQWHFALECFDETDQIISLRTLWTMRNQIVKLELEKDIFEKATDKFAKIFQVDTEKQRLDSVHVFSNMARFGRIRLMSKAIEKFLKSLKRKDEKLFNETISEETKNRYFTKKEGNYFGQIKPSESENALKNLAEEMNEILLKFEKNDVVSAMISYKLLGRIFDEQCEVKDEKVVVKSAKELSATNIQNPSDPDAGYDPHKGQGYQTQIIETYSETKDDENPTLNLITFVETESAAKHDSHAVEPTLEALKNRNIQCKEILADTSYGSNENVEKALQNEIKLISPISGKMSQKGFEFFEIDYENFTIKSCQNGLKPSKIQEGKSSRFTAMWNNSDCKNCPLAEKCPTQKGKHVRKFYYSKEELVSHQRRLNEETPEFKEKYRFRSGIEATNARFIGITEARRSRYRGLEKMRFSQSIKALAINVFRVTKFTKAKAIFVYICSFFAFLTHFFASKSRKQEILRYSHN